MAKTKRRFAGDDDDDSDDEEPVYRGGGKQLRMVGGGKQLRRAIESDDDDDDESEEEAPPYRGGGKQFRPSGGKQLRIPDHDSEDDDDEDDDVPVHPVSRGGGKSLIRPPSDDDDEDEEDSEPVRVIPRGGKSLVRMRPEDEEEEEDEGDEDIEDDDDDDDDDEPVRPVQRGGGKALMGARGGGKQLRPPVHDEDSDEDDSDEEYVAPLVVERASHGGGKQLRRPAPQKSESDEDEDDYDAMDVDEEYEEEVKKPAKKPARRGRPPGRKTAEKAKPTPRRAAAKKAREAMEESDDSSEEELELDTATFDTQTLVQGEEDQKYLDSLGELEREAILGERFEKLKAAADMKKALREQKRQEREKEKKEKAAKKKSARKAPAKKSKEPDTSGDAELAAKLSSRESTRDRDASGAKGKKTAALAQFREDRKSIVQQKEESDEEMDFGSESEDSDEDYEEELKPWQKKKKEAAKTSSRLDRVEEMLVSSEEEEVADSAKAPAVEADLDDYIKVTMPRRRLARWCNEPFFNDAVLGCFVRVFIGESDDGTKWYRLCEVIGVETSKKEYKFPSTSSHHKPITSNKALRVKFGKNEKSFPMYLVSDAKPHEEDVRKYISAQKASRQQVLGKREATRLRKKQDELVNNYTYTQADIDKNIAERKKAGKAMTNLGLEQTRVAIAVQAARSALDDAKKRLDDARRAHLEAPDSESDELKKAVEEAEAAVNEAKATLEEKKEEEKRVLSVVEKRKKKLSKRRADMNWARVNERAAKLNQSADFESYKDQQARLQAEAKSGSKPKFNPYARRKVKPKILWEVGQKEEKKDDDATKPVDNETREDVGSSEANNEVNGGNASEDATPHDVIGSAKAAFMGQRHQFSIDEEALAPDATSILGTSRKKKNGARVRKGLSLAQYQERKSAGTL